MRIAVLIVLLLFAFGAASFTSPSAKEAEAVYKRQVDRAREQYVRALNGAKIAAQRKNDDAEVERINQQLASLEEHGSPSSDSEAKNANHWVVGVWRFRYNNNAIRTYRINRSGKVYFVEENRVGNFEIRGDDVLIDFDDGKLEVVRPIKSLHLDHYNPAKSYPNGTADTSAVGQPIR